MPLYYYHKLATVRVLNNTTKQISIKILSTTDTEKNLMTDKIFSTTDAENSFGDRQMFLFH